MIKIESLRSLGFGGLLGGGLLGLLYSVFPNNFNQQISFEQITLIGAMIGAGGHKLIDEWLINSILLPIGIFFSYYSELIQLVFLKRLLGRQQTHKIMRELTYKYFLVKSSTVIIGSTEKMRKYKGRCQL